jgi:sugar phosphate isomerase/epimerase
MAKVTALSTLTYADYPLGVALERIRARGFRTVDVAHMGYYCQHFPLGAAETEGLRGLLRAVFLQPIALNFYAGERDPNRPNPPRPPRAPHKLNLPDEAEHYVGTLRQVIRQCRSLGIPLLMVHPGRRSEEPDRRAEVEAAARIISALGDEAFANGLRLTLEVPHCFSLLNNLDRVEEMFGLLTSSHVGAAVDTSHWAVLGYDLDDLWRIVGARLWHVHLRDGAGPDTADFRQQLELTPGRGAADFRRFGAWLDRHGFRGNVTAELEYVGRSLDAIEGEIDFAFRHLARCGWEFQPTVRVSDE